MWSEQGYKNEPAKATDFLNKAEARVGQGTEEK